MRRKKAPFVTFDTVAEQLERLEGLTLTDLARTAGYRDPQSARQAFYTWKKNGWLDFTIRNGIYSDFELLGRPMTDKQRLAREQAEESEDLTAFRTWLAVSNAYRLNGLLDGKTLKPKEELEAIKELGRIERGLTSPRATEFARQIEDQLGSVNPWQIVN